LKISVILVDGGFRENIFAAQYFSDQDFPDVEYEIIWVEYFHNAHPGLTRHPKVKTIPLGLEGTYHSSFCFNRGILEAQGELLIIPDADVIVRPDFLQKSWELHKDYERLAIYAYRYDEIERDTVTNYNFNVMDEKMKITNPTNYGGCLTVRKKWLLDINGYEQHPIFATGNHANGLDIYTRLKNRGIAVMWSADLCLYHPWHPFTLIVTDEHRAQLKMIEHRKKNILQNCFFGIDANKNKTPPSELEAELYSYIEEPKNQSTASQRAFSCHNTALILKEAGDGDWLHLMNKAKTMLLQINDRTDKETHILAITYATLGGLNEAEVLFQQLQNECTIGNIYVSSLFYLGEIEYKKGHNKKAIEWFTQVIQAFPSHQKASQYLKIMESLAVGW